MFAPAFPVVLALLPPQLPHFHCCALMMVKAFDLKTAGKIHKCFSVVNLSYIVESYYHVVFISVSGFTSFPSPGSGTASRFPFPVSSCLEREQFALILNYMTGFMGLLF